MSGPVIKNDFLEQALGQVCPCLFASPDHSIFRACEEGRGPPIESVRTILRKDPTAVEARRSDDKATALHVAVMLQDADLVRLLLNSGAHIDATDNQKRTPLHVAALNGNLTIANMLLEVSAERGCDVDSATIKGHTALFLACWRGHLEVAQRMHSSGASTVRVDDEGKTMLQRAKDWNQTRVVKWLEEERERTLAPPRRSLMELSPAPPNAVPDVLGQRAASPEASTDVLVSITDRS